jgi:glycosyltransferase involved in cell wall biosynthesis
VVTIHDVSFLRFPAFAENRNRCYLERTIPATVARADAILTVSQFSADEIVALLGVPPGRVHAVHLGIAPHLRPPEPETIDRLRRTLGLTRPYLLTVGTLEPRKNIPFLVEVFERLAGDYPGDLVLAGAPGWKVGPLLDRIRRSPVADRIRRLDYVPEGDLPALYAGADLFLCASHYEGFGLPPLEAMACGTPVISSPGGSLREVLGKAAVLLEPEDSGAWCASIRDTLSDGNRRRALAAAGIARAALFTWPETARRTWDVYRKVAAS